MQTPRRKRRRFLRSVLIGGALILFLAGVWLLNELRRLPEPSIAADLLPDAPYAAPVWVGNLEDPALVEASGFARSHLALDRMWSLNDSGNAPTLHAVGPGGESQGAVRVKGVENEDWEDLASFESRGVAYLLIAETGDNLSRKARRTLHAVVEPEFESGRAPSQVPVAWSLDFRFEDGPRDCEGVAVDALAREILLVTKRDLPARLYVLALPPPEGPASDAPAVARFVSSVFNIPQPSAADAKHRFPLGAMLGQPTSLDVAPGGASALVLTYGGAYRFPKEPRESWREAFERVPERIRVPPVRGAEAIGFAPGSDSFYLTTEGVPAPLFRYDLPRR